MKAAEDRWVNAAVRQLDIIFAEAGGQRRNIEGEEPEIADMHQRFQPQRLPQGRVHRHL